MVPHDQLPAWQQKSLSRLPDLSAAESVSNSEKGDGKWRFFRAAKEGDVSKQCVLADLGSSEPSQRLRTLS
jgi:hypothetical protein